ncbi:group II intron reverse transcriptase/maturase [Nocardia sp. alder85J]|uniref:group II intron reverse transcriptase/maturase n=1 Tax=Nocardia sp. alder85J TaxID=2862949 RepID=UPI001CD393B3|nr:group II intron reverse transcriptase/maturase [Nocardia sp. alder85J]MCX4093596.1 group II intron reverse transcriptase/maturase [Nocardia sp. alder85J]
MVNGPEGVTLSWDAVDWRHHEDNVRRLRQRIFTATRSGNLATVRNLQKMMLRSWSNTLISVRQATQRNAGRKTAGIDGDVALTSYDRMQLAVQVHHDAASWRPRPVKRVYIPKAGNRAKLRPLGIPVIADRCHQGRVRNALEPEWEARFEPKSYGFRPGRSCHDAIQAIYTVCRGQRAKRVWALDADLAAAFDRIDHSRLLEAIGSFPARDMIRDWLKAGVFEAGKGFAPTDEGTPQGGVISPLLLNIALHGLEYAAGVRYAESGSNAESTRTDSPVVIRYADDLVALCRTQRQAEQVKARLAEWLAPRGLVFNEDKTRIVHLGETGFDFLGFNVRRYHGKLLIKPSKAAVRRIRERLRTEIRALRGSNARAVVARLSPIIKGWAAYYRGVVSKRTFNVLDDYLWVLTYKWATYSHPTKSRWWVSARYFGKFNKFRNNRWVFGDAATGAHLVRFSWTDIVRHTLVKGRASSDDPALAEYWEQRRRRIKPPVDGYTRRLLIEQHGRCPLCRNELLSPDQPPESPQEWERWWLLVIRQAIAADYLVHDGRPAPADGERTRLVHRSCRNERPARKRRSTALQPDSRQRLA